MNQGQLCIPPRPGGGWMGREEGGCVGGRVGKSGGRVMNVWDSHSTNRYSNGSEMVTF